MRTNGTSGGSSTGHRRRRARTSNSPAAAEPRGCAGGGSPVPSPPSAAGRLLLGLLLVSSGTSTGTRATPFGMGTAAAAAAAASTNVAAGAARSRPGGDGSLRIGSSHHTRPHHQGQGQGGRSRRRRPGQHLPRQEQAAHQEQQQGGREEDNDDNYRRERRTRGRDSLLGVPPVRVRTASGGIAFLPPELARASTSTSANGCRSIPFTRDEITTLPTARSRPSPTPSADAGAAVKTTRPRRTGSSLCPSRDDDIHHGGAESDRVASLPDIDTCSNGARGAPVGLHRSGDANDSAEALRKHPHYHHHHHHHHRRTTPTTRTRTRTPDVARNACPRQQGTDGDEIGPGRGGNSITSTRGGGGLLRVPCSISICTDDHRQNPLSQRHHHHHHVNSQHLHHQKPMSSPRAFVDTGAEVTVLSAEAAQRAGLLHLLDRRYAGRATGVGTCRVLGRLPAGCATLVLGEETEGSGREGTITMPCPQLTVLEGTGTEGVDLLIGLDVLDEYGASISLRGGTLTMEPPLSRASPAESPAPRFVIALARNDGDDIKAAECKVAQHESSTSSPPSSSVPPLNLVGAADIGPHDAFRAEVTGSCGRAPSRRRGRQEDHDLMADLELLEQEASCSQFSSGSDWDEEAIAQTGGGGEEEDREESDESEDDGYDDSFDMSGV